MKGVRWGLHESVVVNKDCMSYQMIAVRSFFILVKNFIMVLWGLELLSMEDDCMNSNRRNIIFCSCSSFLKLVLIFMTVPMLIILPATKAYSENAIVVVVGGLNFCKLGAEIFSWSVEQMISMGCEAIGDDPSLQENLESAILEYYPEISGNLDIDSLNASDGWSGDSVMKP